MHIVYNMEIYDRDICSLATPLHSWEVEWKKYNFFADRWHGLPEQKLPVKLYVTKGQQKIGAL